MVKIKISIPGKDTVEQPMLKFTNFALIIGNKLYINPDGYEAGEVKILTIPEQDRLGMMAALSFPRPWECEMLPAYSIFSGTRVYKNSAIPEGHIGAVTQEGLEIFKFTKP